MSRETWLPLVVIVCVALGLAGAWSFMQSRREAEHETEREARARERDEAEAHRIDELGTESAELLHDVLPGVTLGADVETIQAARPENAVSPSTSRTDPGFDLYEEALPNGAQVMYAFATRSHRLERVQVLSRIDDVNAIAPHLSAMHERYGAPTGIWDCRDPGGIATRRFTWRRSHVGLADIALLYGDRISLTLYVTSNEQMSQSLQRAHCVPTPPDQIDHFPTSSSDAVRQAQQEDEGATHP